MANLTAEQKTFIVQRLAMYSLPNEIIQAFREEFGFDIDRQTVNNYHPRRRKENVAPIWHEIFETTRAAFLQQVADIPLANQAFRLQLLQNSLNRVLSAPKINEAMVHEIVERAAKEVGGIHTNRRELTGAEGKPLMDPKEMAKHVYKQIMAGDDADQEQAIRFVTERYKVPEDVLISEAEN